VAVRSYQPAELPARMGRAANGSAKDARSDVRDLPGSGKEKTMQGDGRLLRPTGRLKNQVTPHSLKDKLDRRKKRRNVAVKGYEVTLNSTKKSQERRAVSK